MSGRDRSFSSAREGSWGRDQTAAPRLDGRALALVGPWRRRFWPWILAVGAGMMWAALHLRGCYFFYDEWSMIDRVARKPTLDGMMASFNGHLWILGYWVYRAQVVWFGVNDHTFIGVLFVLALGTLHVSLAQLFRVSGLPRPASVLCGGLLTYLGVASQNSIFAIEISLVLALAVVAAAATIALAWAASVWRSIAVGTVLLAAVGIDSGTALMGIVLVTVIVARTWRPMDAALTVLPAWLASIWWFAVADLGPRVPATLTQKVVFASRLLLHGLGGLVGFGAIPGLVILSLSVSAIAIGLRRRDLTGVPLTMLMAGTLATLVVIGGLAQARTGLPGFNFVDFNRYLTSIAVPAAWALLPALTAVGRAWLARMPHRALARTLPRAVPALIVLAFLSGLRPFYAYAPIFYTWNQQTRRAIQDASLIVRDGCPGGGRPDPLSVPLGDLGPQIKTFLLRDLVARGALHPPAQAADAIDPAIVARMCAATLTPATARPLSPGR